MRDYTCDLCGGHIDLTPENGEEFVPVMIKIGTVEDDPGAEWLKYDACSECSDKLEEFLKSKPYKAKA